MNTNFPNEVNLTKMYLIREDSATKKTAKTTLHPERVVCLLCSTCKLDQLQLVPSGGDNGPRRASTERIIFCHDIRNINS
jgi:hypothetical protein